jgi:NADH dehydrogenase [ubiquinone] 1 alpha subcomplex assembly factor 5
MPQIFDRNALRIHREHCIGNDNFLCTFATKTICDRLGLLQIASGSRVLEIGAGSGRLTQHISHFNLTVTDASAKLLALNPCLSQIICDDEDLDLQKSSSDLILSCLNLHWINEVALFLYKIYCNLRPNGIFVANFVGGSSLRHLRKKLTEMEIELKLAARPHVSPCITKDSAASLLQQVGFKSVVAESDLLEIEYINCLALMRDLKNMGESNKMLKSSGQSLGKSLYLSLLKCSEKFVTEFEIITIYGKK